MLALVLAAAVAGELELSLGYLNAGDAKAPAISLRGGVDLDDLLSVSGRLVGVPGSKGTSVGGGSPVDPAGIVAWSALLEAQVHTRGLVELHVGGGIGVGRIVSWQCSCQETEALSGHTALALQGSAGVRLVPPRWNGFSLGAELIVPHFRGLENATNGRPGYQIAAAPQTAWALLGAIGYRWR